MNKWILIVNDATFIGKIIHKILNEDGCQGVSEAQDGEEVTAVFRQVKPNLVLLGITMPDKSGLEVLKKMLAKEPGTGIVMCSAMGQEIVIQRALVADAVDFIVEPFKAGEFIRIVNCHLSS